MRDPFAGRHRHHSHRRPGSVLRRLARIAVFSAFTAGIAAAAMLATGQPTPPPNPVMTPGQLAQFAQPANVQLDAVNWTNRTCHALTVWERHPTSSHLRTLITDSTHVPWTYLGEDVWQLDGDVHAGAWQLVSDDEQYLFGDCHNGSGL